MPTNKFDEIKRRVSESRKSTTSSWDKIIDEVSNARQKDDEATVDEQYMRKFFSDTESYLSRSEYALNNMSWNEAMDSGAKSRRNETVTDLTNRANAINRYLSKNNSNTDIQGKISEYLDAINKTSVAFDERSKYFSNWKSQDEYDTAARQYGYSKKYDGKTSTELQDLIGSLEDGEEKEWLKSYEDIVGRNELLSVGDSTSQNYDPDFNKYVAQGKEYLYMNDQEYNRRMAEYDDMYFKAETNEERQKALAQMNALKMQYNNIKRTAPNFEGLDEDERQVYLYHLGKDLETGTMDYSDTFYEELTGRKNNAAQNNLQFFQRSKVFDDGFDWYDIPAAIGGTLADAGVGLLKGGLRMGEGIADALGYGVAGVADLFGADGAADTVREGMKWSATDAALGGVSDWVDQASVLGRTSDSLAEGVGQALTLGGAVKAGQAAFKLGQVGSTVLSSLLTFSSSTGLGITEAYEAGATDGQAYAYGAIAGLADTVSEMLWGGLGKGTNAIGLGKGAIPVDDIIAKNVAKVFSGRVGKNLAEYAVKAGFEGLEEVLAGLGQAFGKSVTYMSEKDMWEIAKDENLLEQFIVGAFTSGIMQAVPVAGGTLISDTKAGRDLITGLSDSETFQLDTEFQNYLQKSKDEGYELSKKQQKDLYEKVQNINAEANRKSGGSLTSADLHNLFTSNDPTITAEYTKKLQTTAEERLKALGQTEDVSKLAELAAKYATRQKLSKTEKAFLANNQNGNKVANELRSMNNPSTYKPLSDRISEDEKVSVSDNGKATVNGEEIKLNKKVEVLDFVRDKETGEITDMIINADGKKVKASEIEYADDDQSYLFSAVKRIENITPADAQVIIRDYDPSSGISVGEYLNGVDEAYTYGYHGYTEADMKSGLFTTKLSDEKAKGAYELGKLAKKSNKEAKSEAIKRMRTAVEAEAEKAVAEGKPAPEPKKMAITYNGGNGVVTDFEKTGMKLSKKQRAGVEVAKILHKLGLGTNFEFFESMAKDGNRVFINDAGVEQPAPAGVYMRSDGTIRIDLNAYNGRQLTLYTLSHELTHFIQQWSTEKYEVLAEYLVSTYEKTGLTMHQRVLREQARLKGIRGENISYNEAYDEVVANAMMKMFDDGNLVQRLTELKAKDKNLAMKLWEGLKKTLNKLLGVYQSDPGVFNDTKDLMQMKEDFEVLQGMFAEALVDASENFQANLSAVEVGVEPVAVEDVSQFSYSSLAEAAGFEAVMNDDGTRSFTREGKKVSKVTIEDIENSPIGAFINFSLEMGDISKADADRQKKMFADICTMACKTNDFAMTMQFVGSAVFTGMKANADKQYGTTYDFPSICTKTQAVIDAMSAKMVSIGRGLTADEIVQLYADVFASGNPVPCPECYVFSRWIGIGGLLDNIKKYQDYYGDMAIEDVAAEYRKMKAEVSKFADEQGISFGKAKGALTSKLTKEFNKLTEKIEKAQNQGEKVKPADLKRLEELEPMMNTVKGMTWLENVYFADSSLKKVNPKFRVPNEVLFDLNNGEAFASQYKDAWAFRTTQGAGYGKAITPYAEARLGEGVLVTNNTTNAIKGKAQGSLNNYFLNQMGKLDKQSREALKRARLKQKIQAFIGGQRFQSTSDARYENASDYLLAALEMQAMGGMVQCYTKVDGAVPAFSAWGFSINQSLMPLDGGLDADGNVQDTPVGGMKPSVAFDNRKKHESAGTITIGVNDNHIRAMFKQLVRDFIIPYHASGGKADVVAAFRRIQEGKEAKGKYVRSTDYSRTQSDKVLSDEVLRWQGKTDAQIQRIHEIRDARIAILTGGKLNMTVVRSNRFLSALYDKLNGGEWDGVKLAKSKVESQIFPNEFWDQTVTYEESAKITKDYLEYCEDLGFLHRFSGMVPSNGMLVPVNGYNENGERVRLTDLAYKYDENGNKTAEVEEFFWKVLTDRRMYDNNGNYLAQKVVTLNDTTTDTVTNFAKNNQGRQYDKAKAEALAKKIAGEQYSSQQTDADYMDAVNRGDIETVHNLVDKAAKAAGYTEKVYHGTQKFGFTKIDTKKSDDGISFFAADDLDVAGSYANIIDPEARGINEKKGSISKKTVLKLRDQVKDIASEYVQKYTEILGYYDHWHMDHLESTKKAEWVKNQSQLPVFTAKAINAMATIHDDMMNAIDKSQTSNKKYPAISEETRQKLSDLKDEYIKKASGVISPFQDTGVYGLYANTNNHLVIDAQGGWWNDIKSDQLPAKDGAWNTRDVAKYAKENGYSGVTFKNLIDPANRTVRHPATVYVFFDPKSQLKSADPVTYTKLGRIIPLSKRFNAENKDIRFSTQETDNISNRDMLANAFETLSQNSEEYKMIQEYKGRIRLLNEYEEKLGKLNAEIREIRFGKGKYDAERLAQLEAKAKEMAKLISKNDKKLLSLEASEPLRKVIEQERRKEAQKTKEHVREVQQNKKLRAEQAEYRHKIRKTVRDLDKLLNRGNKKTNVKEDMKGFVSKALELADFIFTDHVSNDELIRKGITVRMTPEEKALVRETEDILTKVYDDFATLTAEEFTDLDDKRKRNMEKLRDLLTSQRNERLKTPVYNLFNDLVTEYASLNNSSQDAVKAAYDPNIERFLRSYIGEIDGKTDSDRVALLQNMRVADMTTKELENLYYAYKIVLTSVRNANKLHIQGKAESIQQVADSITRDFTKRKAPDKTVATVIRNISNKIGWDYEKPYYALDRIGSEAFTELVMNIANSENIVMQDVIEAALFRDEMVKKYGFNKWDVNKKIDREFLDTTGKKFEMTLGQLMSLYAYSRRKGAWDHIEYGGFVFGEKALTNPRPADSYKLTKEQCEAITNTLTKEQKDYVEDMQKFLSETMGEKGNEVSMQLYGIKMFGEKNYFPIHVAGQYMANAQESKAKEAAGFSSMTSAGFTHAQNPNAKAPFVLEGFNEIWADHVNEMSRYHGTVPALEDYRRVMNRSFYSEATEDSVSIRALMENSYGEDAKDYFDNLYKEANSGAIRDKLGQKSQKLLSLFRKNSVAYSLSVWIQQPASIVRAYALIDKKYFGIKGFGAITSGVAKAVSDRWTKAHTNAYNEMLKYAPGVTMAKEIGGFDTATGGSIRSYLLDTDKGFFQSMKTENLKGKAGAAMDLVDDNAIANMPNLADKIAWIEIWNACKRETAAKHKDLATSSEEFMKIVGERFTEVIRATQVYDSIFAKSPMLKSKNPAVQYLVSFMNEPNAVANMAESAVRDAARGNWKGGVRKAGTVIYSIIFTNVLKSLIYAMRDDDEEETYIEKYIEAITGGLMDDFNALNYIPLVRDAWSVAQGYDVERADMAIVSDFVSALTDVIKNATKDTSDMTKDELAELEKNSTEATWQLVGSLASFFGIPVKNVRREIKGVLDHARIASANAGMTTAQSAWDKIQDSVIEWIPFMQNDRTKGDKLYDAIINGDKSYLDRLKGTYSTDNAYQNAVRKALRENDSRIHDAAQARYEGKTEEYKRIFREIQNEGNFSFDDIMSAVNSEETKIRNGVEPDKATSSYSTGGFVEAIILGDKSGANAMKQDIIDAHMANGKTKEEAEKEFKSDVTSSVRDAYSSGLLNEARAKKMLQEYAGKDEEEATSKVNYWAFSEKYPKYKDVFTESHLENYNEFGKPANISVDMYAKYINGTKGLATKYDKWGDVEVSKREQVLEVIDSLPITRKQKDALYLAAGYSESKIWDVPW